MSQTQPAPEAVLETSSQDSKREQSSIVFPYFDLDEAVKIAKAVFELHGSSCSVDQIAAHLRESPNSSSFRGKVSAAKIFGIITGSQGTITLTPLGSQIADQQQEQRARADAFLRVPLYKAIFDKFRNAALPPDNGLESAMVSLGVAQKQKERARQIFSRSAQQAGYFQFGKDRLVPPPLKGSAAPATTLTEEEIEDTSHTENTEKQRKTRDSSGGGEEYHPFIQGLLRKLPPAETDWPMEGRAKWLEAAIKIFDLMYTDSEDSRRSIEIGLKKDSAK